MIYCKSVVDITFFKISILILQQNHKIRGIKNEPRSYHFNFFRSVFNPHMENWDLNTHAEKNYFDPK